MSSDKIEPAPASLQASTPSRPGRYCTYPAISRVILAIALTGITALCLCKTAVASTMRGKVVDSTGAPIADARVFLTQDRRVRVADTGADGTYRFDDVQIRLMELVAWKEGYALGGHTALPRGDMDINLVLSPPASITIRVINNNFMPIPGARVTAMVVSDSFLVSTEDLMPEGLPLLRSDDAGLLEIPVLPEGGYAKLTVSHHHYADSDIAYLPVDERHRDIILYEGARLRGRVTADDTPAAQARVSLFQVGVGGQRKFAEALTDAEGYYHLRAPMDTYLVTARHPDHASPPPQPVDLRDPENVPPADIELLPPYIVSGSIELPDGTPCPGARVLFRADDTIYEDTLTDGNGKFRLQIGMNEGVLRILPPPGYMTEILADIPISLGETRESRMRPIRLVELPVIRGAARFPDDVELSRLYLRSLDLETPIHSITEEDGRFEIRFFYQPEQHIVTFRLEHPLRFLRRDFTVHLEEPGEVEVLLEPFEPNLDRRPHQPGRNNLEPLLGEKAPSIACAEWFNSQSLSLETLRGKVVILTFFGGFDDSPFAMNRLAELRLMHALFREHDDVVVLGVHDAGSEADEVEEYLERLNIDFPVGRDDDPFVSFINYGINFIPQTVLIDKQGILQYAQVEGRLLELIKALRRRP